MDLQTKVKDVFSYKRYAKKLEKLNIITVEDFLFHIPFRYEDYSIVSKIAQVQEGEVVTIRGKIVDIRNAYIQRWKTLQKANVSDDSGIISATWFNQPFLVKSLPKNSFVSLSGKIKFFRNKPTMQSPDYELVEESSELIHTGRLVSIYPETYRVSSKWLRRQIYNILKLRRQGLIEYLPSSVIQENNLINFAQAIEQIHFPEKQEKAKNARYRLVFDEFLLLHLSGLKRRKEWDKNISNQRFFIAKFKKNIEEFWQKLPFELTNAQKRAVSEIFKDLGSKKSMNRLLEGDVGSGKTVVSAIAMYLTCLNGFQSVLMAPTEILAQQHYATISKLLKPFGIKVELITGGKKGIKNQESRIKKIANHNSRFMIHDSKNKIDVLVGTHALLYSKTGLDKLGLVVIDEQQRFGVEQRTLVRSKGKNPHLLTMTATPIPRTIALTLYGDLDLSILDEMPIGRKPVKTWLLPLEKRDRAYKWIEKQILKTKSQAFIVCPFIEESESMQTVKAATKEYEHLRKTVFPKLNLGLLHGKLKLKEKEEVLKKFKDKDIDILVATPVVEVGIDFPNATIIVIEGAERFGLSQLHQLRGRVGRGEKQSYCLLFTESKSETALKRLKAMETLRVGSELAELDLKLRGPGQIFGTMQHGRDLLKIASFSDFSLIAKTKRVAEKIFPELSKYPLLLEKIKNINLKQVSPD
ncbi:MAG: ATP-dependent DNA helicase RecG [Candidatus Levybacteria bacterium]|nr:ATP-dependent DNA helicase RecG [Candidatus Levybacteria bacterium]